MVIILHEGRFPLVYAFSLGILLRTLDAIGILYIPPTHSSCYVLDHSG